MTLILTVTRVAKRFGVQVVSTKILCVLPIQSARSFVSVSGVFVAAADGIAVSASGGGHEGERREHHAPHMLSA